MINDPLRARLRRRLGLEVYEAILGDSDGVVFEPGRPGHVRVRYITSSGESVAQTVRMPRTPTSMSPGVPVWVGYDEEQQLAVIGPRISGQLAAGINPWTNQTSASDPTGGFVDLSQALTLRSSPTPEPSMSVTVKSLLWVRDGAAKLFSGETIDLTSSVPSAAGEHRLVGLFLDLATNEVVIGASAAQSALDPLDLTDVQECLDAVDTDTLPIWFWRLENGMTEITDEHSFLDGRQWINMPGFSGTSSSGTADDLATYLAIWWG